MMFIRKSKVKKVFCNALFHESNEYKKYTKLCSEAIELGYKEAYENYVVKRQSHLDKLILLDDIIKELNL